MQEFSMHRRMLALGYYHIRRHGLSSVVGVDVGELQPREAEIAGRRSACPGITLPM